MSNWTKRTTYLAVGMITLGFIVMVVAWYGAAGFDNPEQQFPYLLSGSVPGLALVLGGLTLALIQEIRKATGAILGRLDQASAAPADHAVATTPTMVPKDGSQVVAGGTSFHSPDCALVEGRADLQPMTAADAAARGLEPCRICDPSEAEAA